MTPLAFTASAERLLVGGCEAKVYSIDTRRIVEPVEMDPQARLALAERESGYVVRVAGAVIRLATRGDHGAARKSRTSGVISP